MSIVKILQPDDWARWDDFVSLQPLGTIYHTSAWRRVIEEAYGHRPLYLIMEDGDNKIKAGLPLFYVKSKLASDRLVCLPGAQACDPLVSSQNEYDHLIAFALDFMNRHEVKSLELKTSEHFRLDSRKFGHELNGYSYYVLDLDRALEVIENSFSKTSIRQKVKKAAKNGLQLAFGNSSGDVKAFYGLYLQLRKNYGLLPQPYKFFSSLWKIMSEEKRLDILHAKYNGQIISSLLLLKYKDTAVNEYAASRFDMMCLGTSPFLYWEAIKYAKLAGYKRFDFGRTADDNESLADFKLRWGTQRQALPYYFIPDLGDMAAIRQKSLSKTLMSFTMQYSPPALCQLLGRALYKYLV